MFSLLWKDLISDFYFSWRGSSILISYELPHDKTNKMTVRPAKAKISLGIWSESSLSAWRKFGSLATDWAHSEDSDQTERMPMLIWVFAGLSHFVGFVMLLLISCFTFQNLLE